MFFQVCFDNLFFQLCVAMFWNMVVGGLRAAPSAPPSAAPPRHAACSSSNNNDHNNNNNNLAGSLHSRVGPARQSRSHRPRKSPFQFWGLGLLSARRYNLIPIHRRCPDSNPQPFGYSATSYQLGYCGSRTTTTATARTTTGQQATATSNSNKQQ
jgi:hypothetical protein